MAPFISVLWYRLQQLRREERGMTTEAMIITGLLAGAALLVVGWIVVAIRDKGAKVVRDINNPGP
ncbi:MAG: hypothetical protein ACRD0U_15855 [Acidimicrobiales bacterium]